VSVATAVSGFCTMPAARYASFMTRLATTLACVAALATGALANGRPPQTSSIHFRPGAENEILAGMSFGLLFSKDNGATWRWMCEDVVPYAGMYDPDYEIMASGAIYATTFEGFRVMRDACTFDGTVLDPVDPNESKFFSVLARDAAATTIYAAAADPKDANIYKSTDDGTSFTPITQPGMINDWYQSLEVAKSDPDVIYLSGYRFVNTGSGTTKEFFMFKSTNGGGSWSPVSLTNIATMSNSVISIVGIGKTDPQHIFVQVTLEDNALSDAVYESTDGGGTWTRIHSEMGAISFLLRANGDVVIGTQTRGSVKRANGQSTFTTLANAPHINCLAENSAGEVWACTQNYGSPAVPMDGYGIMKSTDLATWTPAMKYQDILEPVTCPMNTAQYQKCDRPMGTGAPPGWCGLCAQLGCDPKRECNLTDDEVPVDGGDGGGKKGCCETGNAGAPGALALALMIGIVLSRRRRRR
jgi:uncharacterized protein (TIGR03382 family)